MALVWGGVDYGLVDDGTGDPAPATSSSSPKKTIALPPGKAVPVDGSVGAPGAGWTQAGTITDPGASVGWFGGVDGSPTIAVSRSSADQARALGFVDGAVLPSTGGVDGAALANPFDDFLSSRGLSLWSRPGPANDTQVTQAFNASGQAVGPSAVVSTDDNQGLFGVAVGLAAAFAGGIAAAASGGGSGAAAAASVDAAPTSYDAFSQYLVSGASDGSTVGGFGGYAGAVGVNAAPEVLSAAVPGWGVSTVAIDAAPSSSLASSSSSAAPAASTSTSLLGGGTGALGLASQVAGLVSAGAGLVSQLTGGAPRPSSSSSSPALVAADHRRSTLLLVAGAVALVLILRK